MKNPHAFPVPENFCTQGMTLRDFFAAHALNSAYTMAATYGDLTGQQIHFGEMMAKVAYEVADKMLEVRGAK
jgi:hypothetical protein